MSTLPLPRLVTLSHTAEGASYISSSAHLTPSYPFGPGTAAVTTFHSTPRIPASNNGPAPIPSSDLPPRPDPNGAIFCTTDFPPRYSAPMHRTQSLDYAVVLSGSITVVADDSSEAVLRAGECVLQRGTNHVWANRSDEWCRILFVVLGAEKVVCENGTVLEATM